MEVLISSLVMAVTVLGVAASVATSGGMGDRARDEMRARRAAQSWIRDIQARPFREVGYTMHQLDFHVAGLKTVKDDPDGRVGEIVFSEGPVAETYYVDIRVLWENRGGAREIRSRIVLADLAAEGGHLPSIGELDVAAATRSAAPASLREILEFGEELLLGEPGARWADPLSLAMDHVREAELLLGSTPVDLSRVIEQLESAVTQIGLAADNKLGSGIAETMTSKLSGLIAGMGGGS